MTYLFFFLAGLFGANGVPHFVKGITGDNHMTPFSKPSGAVLNVLWGTLNFFIAAWLLQEARTGRYDFMPALIAATGGILITAVSLALLWQNDEIAKGR